MRILLDECVPATLAVELVGHEVHTVPQMGWASQENGNLLALAEGKFDVLLTTDQRISYQQAVSKFSISLVVLVARRNKIEFLVRLLPDRTGRSLSGRCLTTACSGRRAGWPR